MFSEIIVCIEIENSILNETKKDIAKVCKSKFDTPDSDKEEYEAIFKLLLKEVQKQSIKSE